jgi:hypothetical protein
VGWVSGTCGVCAQDFGGEISNERGHLEDLNLYGMIILEWVLVK